MGGKSPKWFTGNNVDFYCKQCRDRFAIEVKPTKQCRTSETMSWTVKDLRKLSKNELDAELRRHRVYTGYELTNVVRRKLLQKHYVDHHITTYKRNKTKNKKSDQCKVTYEDMDIKSFVIWAREQHLSGLRALHDRVFHYIDRIPEIYEESKDCLNVEYKVK